MKRYLLAFIDCLGCVTWVYLGVLIFTESAQHPVGIGTTACFLIALYLFGSAIKRIYP